MNLTNYGENQTEITFKNHEMKVFFSYKTPVAFYDDLTGKYYKTSKFWSKTTSRHINNWLDGEKAEEKEQGFFDGLTGGL